MPPSATSGGPAPRRSRKRLIGLATVVGGAPGTSRMRRDCRQVPSRPPVGPPVVQGAAPALALCASSEPDDYRRRVGAGSYPFRLPIQALLEPWMGQHALRPEGD